MPTIERSRLFLKSKGIELSSERLEPLVELLHYLAKRVCEQIESEREEMRISGDRSQLESYNRDDESPVSDVRPEKVSLKNRKMA